MDDTGQNKKRILDKTQNKNNYISNVNKTVSTQLFVTRHWRTPRYAGFQRSRINGINDSALPMLTIEENFNIKCKLKYFARMCKSKVKKCVRVD